MLTWRSTLPPDRQHAVRNGQHNDRNSQHGDRNSQHTGGNSKHWLAWGVFALPVTVLAVARPKSRDPEAMNVGFRPMNFPKSTFIPSQSPEPNFPQRKRRTVAAEAGLVSGNGRWNDGYHSRHLGERSGLPSESPERSHPQIQAETRYSTPPISAPRVF